MKESPSHTVRRLALSGPPALLRDDEVFIKTHFGRIEAQSRHSTLPRRLRAMLMVIDGRRPVGLFRQALDRFRNLDETFDMLEKMGYVERLPQRLDV